MIKIIKDRLIDLSEFADLRDSKDKKEKLNTVICGEL